MKTFLTTLIIAASITAQSQPFFGLSAGNGGITYQAGALAESIEITAAYKMPLSKNDRPSVLSISVGKQILLTNNESDNYSITPTIGFANYRVKDFTKYDQGSDEIIQVSEFKPVFGLEVGKDSHMGRVFISANYCKVAWFSIGIKVFTHRK